MIENIKHLIEALNRLNCFDKLNSHNDKICRMDRIETIYFAINFDFHLWQMKFAHKELRNN